MKPDLDVANLTFTLCQYGTNHLQRLGVWTTPSESSAEAGGGQTKAPAYWIVFIHGGAWRDPRNTFEDFTPSIKAILASPHIANSSIRGFASIDYRLSTHPNFPQEPADTSPSDLRVAKHPDHVLDVRCALAYLDEHYAMGQDYILMGHSAGGTLTYQLLMGDAALANQPTVPAPLPRVAIGISGIYDMPGLVARFEGVHGGVYRNFVTGAFGSDEELWKAASPVNSPNAFAWPGGKAAILAWSPEDTMIDQPEIDRMAERMKADGTPANVFTDLTGDHEVVWEEGMQIARLVAEAMTYLDK